MAMGLLFTNDPIQSIDPATFEIHFASIFILMLKVKHEKPVILLVDIN